MKSTAQWGAVAVAIIALIFVRCAAAPHELLGQPAPDISLRLLEGGERKLSAHEGNEVVVLDFWATWCGPCLQSMPILAAIEQEYADRGVALYAVNVGEPPALVASFLEDQGWDITVAVDPAMQAARDYVVNGIPQTVIIDKAGRIQAVHVGVGPNYRANLEEDLDAVLAGRDLIPKPTSTEEKES
ncbi:MAG: TlpA disulfide reductase family protein [Candidatus Hydrogenedentales bacterium]